MEARARLVGIFTLVGLALIVAGIAAIGSGRIFSKYRTVVVFFPDPVVGLKEGAPVTFRRAPFGQVREVELVFTGNDLESEFKVVADVRRGALRDIAGRSPVAGLSDHDFVETLAKAGLRAAVRSSTPLAGQKSLDLYFDPESTPRYSGLPMPYPEVPTAPSGLDVFQDRFEAVLEKLADIPVTDVVVQLRATLDSAQKLLGSGNLDGALVDLRRGLRAADKTLQQVERTLGGLDGVVQDARTTLASADHALKGLDSTFERLDRTLTSVDQTLGTVDQTLGTVDRSVERLADTQHAASRTLDEMNELARSLRHLVEIMQRNPEALLLGKPAPEKRK